MKNISTILFLDIETVSVAKSFDDLDDSFQELWERKSRYWIKDEEKESAADLYRDKAGIYSEFAKIVCISVGYIGADYKMRLKSFYDDDEKVVLMQFSGLLLNYYNNPLKHKLCGHNIKEFDIPFICRRLIINNMPIPPILNVSGKKPWETKHLLDTMEMWKFGDYKNYTSLNLLANVFGIKSPKDDIDGSQVGRVYWEEGDLERIKVYCEKDVKTVAQVYLRISGLPLLADEEE